MEVLGSLTKNGRSAFVNVKSVDEDSNANVNDEIICLTDTADITVTIPALPTEGDFLSIIRQGSNDVIVDRNGSTIMGLSEDLTINLDGYGVQLLYANSTWNIVVLQLARTGIVPAYIPITAIDTDPTFAGNSDSKIPSQSAVKTALEDKADQITTYTKEEVDEALEDKANTADLGTAASQDVEYFATAEQGSKADTALSKTFNVVTTTTNITAVAFNEIWVNSTTGAVVVTLPEIVASGDTILVFREGTNPVTIARNGLTINGVAENLVLDTTPSGCRLTYIGGTWKVRLEIIAQQ